MTSWSERTLTSRESGLLGHRVSKMSPRKQVARLHTCNVLLYSVPASCPWTVSMDHCLNRLLSKIKWLRKEVHKQLQKNICWSEPNWLITGYDIEDQSKQISTYLLVKEYSERLYKTNRQVSNTLWGVQPNKYFKNLRTTRWVNTRVYPLFDWNVTAIMMWRQRKKLRDNVEFAIPWWGPCSKLDSHPYLITNT